MASSKTLTPTNVTISIPAMTDVPDASVFSNCVDKEADAINALKSSMEIQGISGVDFNTLTGDASSVKYYNGNTFAGCTNVPSTCSGQAWPFVLEVIKFGGYAKQIIHCFAVSNQAPNSPTYVRQQTYANNVVVWSTWSTK